MGKPKGKNPKVKKFAKKKGLVEGDKNDKYSVEEIMAKAEEFMDQLNFDMAQKFCQRALEIDQDHVKALEVTASLLLEGGDVENAKCCLGRAITVQPEEGHSKYLTMGQLFAGEESLQLYNKGIQILTSARDSEEDEGKVKELSRSLSNALCSVGELYMTDLCDEENAEDECQSCIQKAIDADKSNPEALQTKARYLLIRAKFDEAKTAIKESLDLWLPAYQDIIDNKQGASNFDPVDVCPLLYTTRIGTSKLLIEMEMWDEATQILEGLLEEDDECVETWYLLGWLNRLRAIGPEAEEGYNSNARFYLKRSKKVNTMNPTGDKEMVQHINEILEELGPDPNPGDDEEAADENWEDVEDTGEEEEEEENMES